jgi:predicted dehydrogenase
VKTIGVGVIGRGFGANVQVPQFRNMPGVEVIGVAGRDSWRALVADDRVSAVSVATAPIAQHEIVKSALEHGKHVLCEKPFGLNVEQAQELCDAARKAGVVHMVDFLFRTAPERVRLRQLLEGGAIGRLLRVNVEWTMAGRATKALDWRWQMDPAAGGGALFAFGSHVLDYLEWLVGPIRSVSGHLSVCGRHATDEPNRAMAEDTVDALMVIGDGVPASVSISNAVPAPRGHWLSIHGEGGTLVVGSANPHDAVLGTSLFQVRVGESELRPLEVERLDASVPDGRSLLFRRIADAFIDAIRSGQHVPPTFEDGRRAQVVAYAIRDSHARQRWIAVV